MPENCWWKCSFLGVNRQRVYPENVGQTTHLPARENYGEGIWQQDVKWKFLQCGKIASERVCGKTASESVVFLVLTVNVYTQKTSNKQHIYPLGKTTVKAYDNKMLNGRFLNAGKLLVNV